eukprot:13403621-Alexandrium_andersonii.AAC.1
MTLSRGRWPGWRAPRAGHQQLLTPYAGARPHVQRAEQLRSQAVFAAPPATASPALCRAAAPEPSRAQGQALCHPARWSCPIAE